MPDSSSRNNDGCEAIRELIAWYPGQTLDESERKLVDEHVLKCSTCADMLRFVSIFREQIVARYAPHVEPELLVRFAEDRSAIDSRQRAFIEEHLAACAECREQAMMLETIDRDIAAADTKETVPLYAAEPTVPAARGAGGLWNALRNSVLRPVPAAVYLVVAVVAIVLLLGRPERLLDRGAPRQGRELGVVPDPGDAPGTIGGIVILADEMGRVRQPGRDEVRIARIDSDESIFLLLELTGLEAPPADDARYTVSLLPGNSAEPVLEAAVRGEIFSETYTLCLSLKAGALAPGRYTVTVADPDGKVIYRSSIDAR